MSFEDLNVNQSCWYSGLDTTAYIVTKNIVNHASLLGRDFIKNTSENIDTFKKKAHELSQDIIQNKVVRFIKKNWPALIAFTIAWSVIITGTGLLYGFSAVAWPLSIGLSCGLAFGLVTGVITKFIIKPDTPDKNSITLWELFNTWINGLDANGTRAMVTSVIVTVVLAAAVFFPIAVGSVFGFVMGNHLSTKVVYEYDFGARSSSLQNLRSQYDLLDTQMKELNKKIETFELQQKNM